ncbi:DUF4365 domain-containing protein [bacterium]|nr:DUF4365 domain-containing protein [bacterium]
MVQEKRPKRKTESHIIENLAINIIEESLPDHWTIRSYKPDYGLDLSIELFEFKKNDRGDTVYDTLGEHIYVQVKGTKAPDLSKYTIYERSNVEKEKVAVSKKAGEIDVIKFQLDTNEIYTIDRMSSAVPVFLFVVDVNTKDIFFLCMNDYIDKVLVPNDDQYFSKTSKTIYIPLSNKITRDEKSHYPLMFYAKRAKYYSFFNKCNYQHQEIQYLDEESLMSMYPHFLEILLRFDIWDQSHLWPLLEHYHSELTKLKDRGSVALLEGFKNMDDLDKSGWETDYSGGKTYSKKETLQFMQLRSLWDKLSILGTTYEETCREWFLPCYFSYLVDP